MENKLVVEVTVSWNSLRFMGDTMGILEGYVPQRSIQQMTKRLADYISDMKVHKQYYKIGRELKRVVEGTCNVELRLTRKNGEPLK